MIAQEIEATKYVLDRSWTCRRNRKGVAWLVREAIEALPGRVPENADPEVWRTRIRNYLAGRLKRHGKEVGNPILIFILLNIVLPIVVRLVIEWWLHRKTATA